MPTRDAAYAYVAATTFAGFVAYGIFTTVTVLVFTKDDPHPEIMVLSHALAKSDAMRGCFIAYAAVDVVLRLVWETMFIEYGIGKKPFSRRTKSSADLVRCLKAALFVTNPVWQIYVGAISMYEYSVAHSAMAMLVVSTYLAYMVLSIVLHVGGWWGDRSEVVSVGIAAEVLAVVATIVGASCFLASACTASTPVVTHAWYEYMAFTSVALMGANRAIDVALTPIFEARRNELPATRQAEGDYEPL